MLHQAAKTVQRSIRRFIGSSDTARQRAVATFQQKEDALFNIYLSRLRAIQLMCMGPPGYLEYFMEGTILHVNERQLKEVDIYREHLAEIPNHILIQMIQEDRKALPFQYHEFFCPKMNGIDACSGPSMRGAPTCRRSQSSIR